MKNEPGDVSEPESECENKVDCHLATIRLAALNSENQAYLDNHLTGPLLRANTKIYGTDCGIGTGIFDSGAPSSLVSVKVLRRANLRWNNLNQNNSVSSFTGLMGGSGEVKGEIYLCIQWGNIVMIKHRFLVIDILNDEFDFYIGKDFLEKNKLILDPGLQTVTYTENDNMYIIHLDMGEVLIDKVNLNYTTESNLNCNMQQDIISKEVIREKDQNSLNRGENHSITDLTDIKEKLSMGKDSNYQPWNKQTLGSKVKIGDHLTSDQREKVLDMLMENCEVFSKGPLDIGLSKLGEYSIKLTSDEPVYEKPRYHNPTLAKLIQKEIDDLLVLGIIEESQSSYNSRIVPVKKYDDKGNVSLRLCCDFRSLNKLVVPDRYPMRNIQDSVFNLGNCNYFTGLDLVKGYFQLSLSPESRPATAFTANGKHYQFTRLVQGLSSSPAAFQREIMKLLGSIEGLTTEQMEAIIAFLDDILAKGNDFDDHLHTVDRLLKKLIKSKLKVKPGKCSFFVNKIKFLGFICGKDGIAKSEEFFSELRDYEPPVTVKDLRSFLGIVGFHRNHMKDFATIANPMNKWLGRPDKDRLEWDEELKNSFETVKKAALENVKLAYPDYSCGRSLILTVDASLVAAGYYLSQEDENGNERVIAYASNTFNKAQQAYSATERELQAIRMGITSFKDFLGFETFVVRTDHYSLLYLMNMALCNSRLARTLIDLSDFTFSIEHIKGELNYCADALSRLDKHYRRSTQIPVNNLREYPGDLEVIFKPEGGGNSLVDCLLKTFELNFVENKYGILDTVGLRQQLADELVKHATEYNIEMSKDRKHRINGTRMDGNVPVLEFLDAFSKLYECQIRLHYGSKFPLVVNFSKTDANVVNLQWVSGIHFNLFMKKAEVNYALIRTTGTCNHDLTDHCIVKIKGGDSSLCAMIDSGSSISICNRETYEDFKRIGCIGRESYMKFVIDSFSSTVYREKQLVVDVRYKMGNRNCISKFLVMEGDHMAHCIIIGTNILQQYEWKLDFRKMGIVDHQEDMICSFVPYPKPQRKIARATRKSSTVKATIKYVGSNAFDSSSQRVLSGSRVAGFDRVIEIQRSDFVIDKLREWIKSGRQVLPTLCSRFRRTVRNLKVTEDAALVNTQYNSYVMPFYFTVGYCIEIHFNNCHVGKRKLIELVKSVIYHPSIDKICEEICSTCDACQKAKYSGVRAMAPLIKVQTSYPGEIISVDLLNLPQNNESFVGVMVAIDLYTKYACVVPIKNKSGSHIARNLEERIMPGFAFRINSIVSDQGKEFISAAFNEVLGRYNIEHLYSSPGYPKGNAGAERFNKTFLQLLNLEVNDMRFWPAYVTKVLQVYNGSFHSELRMSPRDFILKAAHATRPNGIESSKEKAYWKHGNGQFRPFSVGDKVLKEIKYVGDCTRYKLMDKFQGPYTITKIFPNLVTYLMVNEQGEVIRTHYNYLRSYRETPAYIRNHDAYKSCMNEEVLEKEEQPVTPSTNSIPDRLFTFEFESESSSESEKRDETFTVHREQVSLNDMAVQTSFQEEISTKTVGVQTDPEVVDSEEVREREMRILGTPIVVTPIPVENIQTPLQWMEAVEKSQMESTRRKSLEQINTREQRRYGLRSRGRVNDEQLPSTPIEYKPFRKRKL